VVAGAALRWLNETTKAGLLIEVRDRCLGIWLERGEREKLTARLRHLRLRERQHAQR
jgi:Zn-finger nucleic acid-binding protein